VLRCPIGQPRINSHHINEFNYACSWKRHGRNEHRRRRHQWRRHGHWVRWLIFLANGIDAIDFCGVSTFTFAAVAAA
jgi:hypothetical protein